MNNESFVNEIKGLGQLTRQLFRLLFGKGFTLAHAIFENVAIDRPKKYNILVFVNCVFGVHLRFIVYT